MILAASGPSNIALLAVMLIVLLLIVGVVGALRAAPVKAKEEFVKVTPVIRDDTAGLDLESRLQRIVLTSLEGYEDPPGTPLVEKVAPPHVRYRSGITYDGEATAADEVETPSWSTRLAGMTSPAGRLALPSTLPAAGDPATTVTPTSFSAGGLSPLAERFSTSDQPTEITPPGSPLGSRPPQLPVTMAPEIPTANAAHAARGSNVVDSGMPANPAPPSTRLGLPGTVGGGAGFTVVSPTATSGIPSRESSGILPPSTVPPLSQPTSRRPELPGNVAPAPRAADTPSIDIRAILRGEAMPIGALPSSSGFVIEPPGSPIKPNFATGPLPPPLEQGVPLGATPFDPNALRMRQPASNPALPAPSEEVAGSGLSSGIGARYSARQPLGSDLSDLDATRIMDDFDLPETGFETHVFSTAELVDAESEIFTRASTRLIESSEPLAPESDRQAPAVRSLAQPDAITFSPAIQEQARHHLSELAALTDVVFVKLITSDGILLLSLGSENGNTGIEESIAALTSTAGMEVRQLDLDTYNALSLEASSAALLVSPVHDGVALAVFLSNPARLGLLRRQIRKPLASIRTLLMESRVS